jgi:hypothetical protein
MEQNVEHQPVWEIPKLRRVIEITDLESSEPIVHKLERYKTDRIDCYDVYVDNAIWKKRTACSQVLAYTTEDHANTDLCHSFKQSVIILLLVV